MADHDQLKLARAVGVFDTEDYYRQQLYRIAAREEAREEARRERWDRIGNVGAGVLMCCILGIYIVLSFTMGATA